MANIYIIAKDCSINARGRYLNVTLEDVDIDELCESADLVTKESYDELKDTLEDEINALSIRIDELENRLTQ